VKKSYPVLILIYCTLLYAQFFNIYSHYFEFTNSDRVSLGLSLVIPFFLARKFIKTTHKKLKITGAVLLIVIPIVVQTLIENLLGRSDYAWIVMHVIIAIGGSIAAVMQTSQWVLPPLFSIALAWAIPFNLEESQIKYFDKVIAGIETRKGSGQIVQWKDDYWLHYNDELQFSTIDNHVFSEALIQPVMHLEGQVRSVLIIGGDNGLLADELSKFTSINKIVILLYDQDYYDFVTEYSEVLQIGRNNKVMIVNKSPQHFLVDTTPLFDLIVIDLPEPKRVEFQQYYSEAFYRLCFDKLRVNGSLVTKTASSYIEFEGIDKYYQHMQLAGFNTLGYHTQIPSLGQYSWAIGSKKYSTEEMSSSLKQVKPKVSTIWWNQEAMKMMLSFGKTSYFSNMVYQSAPL